MFCRNCGKENVENAVFCSGCGSMLNAETYVQPAETPVEEPVNPVISTVKKVLSSTLFLVLAILLTVTVAWTATSMSGASVYREFVDSFTESYEDASGLELEMDFYEYEAPASAFITGTTVIGIIPLAFVVAGIWMLYSSAKNKQQNINLKGLTLIKTGTIIDLIASCLVSAIFMMLSLLMIIGGATMLSGITESDVFIGGVLLACGIIFMIMFPFVLVSSLLLHISALNAIKNVRETVESGTFTKKIPMLLIVMLFISAVGGGSLVLAASYVVAGLVLINYNKEIQTANEMQENAVDAQVVNQ